MNKKSKNSNTSFIIVPCIVLGLLVIAGIAFCASAKLRAANKYAQETLSYLEAGAYSAIFISMDSTETVNPDDFEIYRGLKTYICPTTDIDKEVLEKAYMKLLAEKLPVETLYLSYNPFLFKQLSAEKCLSALRENNPELDLEIMVQTPALSVWQQLDHPEEYLDKLTDTLLTFTQDGQSRVFFSGDQEWLIANNANYEACDLSGETIYIPSVTHTLLLSIICDLKYLLPQDSDWSPEQLSAMISGVRCSDDYASAYHSSISGRQLIMLGDSVIGNYTDSFSIPAVISSYSDIEALNCGYNGLCMTQRKPGGGWAGSVIDAVLSGDGSTLPDVPAKTSIPLIREDTAAVYILTYGINDYISGCTIENPEDAYDTATYMGAYRTAIEKLQQDAQADIILCTPTYIEEFNGGTDDISGMGYAMSDYCAAVSALGAEYNLKVLDLQNELPFSYNGPAYLVDKVHPNEYGRYLVARKILELVEN